MLPPAGETNDEVEKLALSNEVLFLGWRWAIGKRESDFFFRPSLKNVVVVVETVCVVVVVLPYTLSPELASDLDDSDNLLAGSARVDECSSPYDGGSLG